MKNLILVPTDFSENALLAARFAIGLAKHAHKEICLLHAFTPFRSAFQPEAVNDADYDVAQKEALQAMVVFRANLAAESQGVETSTRCVEGKIADALNRFISESSVCLVIMGTTGASGLKYQMLGSNTFEVAKRLKLPLIVVPPGTHRFEFQNVAFFTDFNSRDLHTLSSLRSVLPSSFEKLQLIHFGRAENRATEEEKLNDWAGILAADAGLSRLTWKWVEGQESIEAIESLSKQESFDLFVLTLVERGFFEQLFMKSMARELIHQSTVPVFLVSEYSE